MPKKGKDGQNILTAGEVGAYTVCPKSWYLSEVKKLESRSIKDSDQKKRVRSGNRLHREWSETLDSASTLMRTMKFILLLVLLSILLFLISQ